MHRLKLGPLTVNVSLKGVPSSDDLLGCETGNTIKLLDRDVRRDVFEKWTNLLFQTEPCPVIRPQWEQMREV